MIGLVFSRTVCWWWCNPRACRFAAFPRRGGTLPGASSRSPTRRLTADTCSTYNTGNEYSLHSELVHIFCKSTWDYRTITFFHGEASEYIFLCTQARNLIVEALRTRETCSAVVYTPPGGDIEEDDVEDARTGGGEAPADRTAVPVIMSFKRNSYTPNFWKASQS